MKRDAARHRAAVVVQTSHERSEAIPLEEKPNGDLVLRFKAQPGLYRLSVIVDASAFDWESLYVNLHRFHNKGQRTGPWDFNIASGGSSILNPAGVYLVEPVFDEETILYAELDQDDRRHTKAYVDALGHYARWDILRLDTRGEPNQPFTVRAPDIPYGRIKEVAERHGADPDRLEKMLRELEN